MVISESSPSLLFAVKFIQKAEVMNNMANGNGNPKEERQTKMKGETQKCQ